MLLTRDKLCSLLQWMLLPLFALVLADAASQCPKLPTECKCESNSGGLAINCNGIGPDRIFKLLSDLNIERLTFKNCSAQITSSLPRAVIKKFSVTECPLKFIPDKLFLHVSEALEEINLPENEIEHFPNLGSLPTVNSLNLNGNRISSIPEGILKGLPSLKYLRIERNNICSLPKAALNETKSSLQLLDVSGNCLAAVPAANLGKSTSLMYLDLSQNKIQKIGRLSFVNMPALVELRLHENNITEIDPMAFANVPSLKQLNLRNNALAGIDIARFEPFEKLEALDLSDNLITKIPPVSKFLNLKQLRFDRNQIRVLEAQTFSTLPQLQLLSLQNNYLAVIPKDTFISLDALRILLLANNSIKAIEKNSLDGMKSLQQISLRNNSLSQLDINCFALIPEVTSVDLAENNISRIGKSTFAQLTKLFWLDLSKNKITSLPKGTFDRKIGNIILTGNPIQCDESNDWLITYLITNRVRTYLPFQEELICAGPEKYQGVPLRDVMIKKANETLLGSSNSMQKSWLGNFIPGLNGQSKIADAASAGIAAAPFLNTLTNALPALRNLPGLNGQPIAGAANVPMNRDFHNAMEQFTGPLVRFATGGQPVASDIEQLIQSIPGLVVNIPGFGNIDVSKLDPNLVKHVLNGGTIPGIPKETTDNIIKQYMNKMVAAAQLALKGPLPDNMKNYLPPLEKLPSDMVSGVLAGENLPMLNAEQTKIVKDYYMHVMPSNIDALPTVLSPNGIHASSAVKLMQMLPAGYDITKIPSEVIQTLSQGGIPDMKLLPQDLQNHLREHYEDLVDMFSKQGESVPIDELLQKLPNFERPTLETFESYDLNRVSHELHNEEAEALKASHMRVYTAIAFGVVAVITLGVLIYLFIHTRHHPCDHTSLHPSSPPLREPKITRILTSTQLHDHDN